jgi:hypothetical protein
MIWFIILSTLIGIPLLMIGSALIGWYSFDRILNFFPHGRLLRSEFRKMFHRMFSFLKALINNA